MEEFMAQRVEVVLIDDIDGGNADETVRFSLDGTSYEIELSAANARRLRDAFAPYVGHGRKAAARSRRRSYGSSGGAAGGRSAEIRAWAKERGLEVNERGRIPADLAAKFEAAH
jgi:hypothetical protein